MPALRHNKGTPLTLHLSKTGHALANQPTYIFIALNTLIKRLPALWHSQGETQSVISVYISAMRHMAKPSIILIAHLQTYLLALPIPTPKPAVF